MLESDKKTIKPNEENVDEKEQEEEKKEEQKKENLNEDLLNEELLKEEKEKEKEEELFVVDVTPNNNVIYSFEQTQEEPKKDPVQEKLEQVSKSSGLNMRAYFIEESAGRIKDAQAGKLGASHFEFRGDMKDFYSKVYRHVLESNLIARQLSDGKQRENLPSFKELSSQFEDFMKATGEELVKRGHLDKYIPYGGLTASELKEIENSCLLNRPRNEKEALERNATNVSSKNFDEVVENGYKNAEEKINNFLDPSYIKGEDPEVDKRFLKESSDLIKGMRVIRDKEKVWETYKPNLSAPKWNKPIYKHPISNAFKALGRGIGIALDCIIKTPLVNIGRGIKYPFDKISQVISTTYNQKKLENIIYSKGYSKEELKEYLNDFDKSPLDVEKDAKEIETNFKEHQKAIDENKKENVTKEEVVQDKQEIVDINAIDKENDFRKPIFVNEALDNYYDNEIVPEIGDNPQLNKDKVMNNA